MDLGLKLIGALAAFSRSGSVSIETRWVSMVGYTESTFLLAESLAVLQALNGVTTGVAGGI